MMVVWAAASEFGDAGTHLQSYAGMLRAVEINSSFYRPHQGKTYARWAASVPSDFRFSVKLPKQMTHELRLVNANEPLNRFFSEVQALGNRLGPILVQLPPSLQFAERVAADFWRLLRTMHTASVVCEPRHLSWFSPAADALLSEFRVARVAADPAVTPSAARPGGAGDLVYYRWHGTPRIYYSNYEPAALAALFDSVTVSLAAGTETWCIFDNTALGSATTNAVQLTRQMTDRS